MLLGELLRVPALSSASVVAGAAGLTREVRYVNIMDAPDITRYLKPGELLLTTAYVVKDDPDALRALISGMNEIGCAGIAIKTKRFLPEVPRSVAELADELAFPIIDLPLDRTLGEILYGSVSSLLGKRTEELKYSLESHQNFADLVLRGQGIPEIVATLSRLLGAPTLLFDGRLNEIAASSHFASPPYAETIDSLRAIMASIAPDHPAPSLCLLSPAGLPCRQLVIHPIQTVQLQGYLVAFADEGQASPLPGLAVEQAVNVIRFELLKKQAVKERSRRYKSEFFSDLVEGIFASEQEVLHRGRKYGLKDRSLSFCIVVKRDSVARGPATGSAPGREDAGGADRETLYDAVKKAMSAAGLSFALFNKNDAVVLVASLPRSEGLAAGMPAGLDIRLKEAIALIETETGAAVSAGVGKPVAKLLDCPVTYKEAMEALHIGYRAKRSRFVQFYTGKETIDLFRLVPEEELHHFKESTFAGLEDLDPKESQELLRTLHVYLENHGQIAETAKQLFIHRNTVLYRLDKLRQLTGRDANLPGDSLRYRIAFLIEPLLKGR